MTLGVFVARFSEQPFEAALDRVAALAEHLRIHGTVPLPAAALAAASGNERSGHVRH